MSTIRLTLSRDEFRRLPRHPAYKYEYIGGQACISPRPRHFHALLTLRRMPVSTHVECRPCPPEAVDGLVPLFAAAFRHTEPFAGLDESTRQEAARQALERTRTGGDGPWVHAASFVAVAEGSPVGAVLITLLPEADPTEWTSYYWSVPPPPDCVERRLGRPHLTWIFVSPLTTGRGVGTALLAAAVNRLTDMGYRELLTTFLIGNDASALWHWRNGFQLLAHPGSFRTKDGGD